MAGMNGNRNGNSGQRGQAERPPAATGDQALVGLKEYDRLCDKRKAELTALFFEEKDPEGAFRRMAILGRQILKKLRDSEAAKGRDPDKIDVYSLLEATVSCMRLDLAPGIEAYFVPYEGIVQLIPSPDGVIKNAYRSGFVKDVRAGWVFQGDEFDYDLGSESFVKHKPTGIEPSDKNERWQKMTHAYCVVHTTTGGKVCEVLPKSRIEYYRSLSPTFSRKDQRPFAGSLWDKFPTEAGRKAALKQGLKNVPKDWRLAATLRDSESHDGIVIPDDIWEKIRGGEDVKGWVGAMVNGGTSNASEMTRDQLEERAIAAQNEQQRSLPMAVKDMSDEHLRAFIEGKEFIPAGASASSNTAAAG